MINSPKAFKLLVDIRSAQQTLVTAFKEQRTEYRGRLKILQGVADSIYDRLEDGDQGELFELTEMIPEDVNRLIGDPLGTQPTIETPAVNE